MAAASPRSAWRARAPWVAAAVVSLLLLVHRKGGGDTRVFWRAGQRFWQGAPLYPAADGFMAFRYAPGTGLLFAPLAPMPFTVARCVWGALLALSIAWVFWHLVGRGSTEHAGRAALAAGVFALRPGIEEAYFGQANAFVLVLLLASFVLEDRGRERTAGAVMALAIALKLAPALFLLDWVARRRWRPLSGAALGGAALLALPVPLYGVAGTIREHRAWIASLLAASGDTAASEGNQSLLAAGARLGLPAWAALAACVALVAWALALRDRDLRRDLLLLLTALASPMGWLQNFLFALPTAFRLAARSARAAAILAILGVAFALPIHDVTGPAVEHAFFRASGMTWPMLAVFLWAAASRPAPRRPQHADG